MLTLYKNWQPQLLTTTSTGSGAHFCGGVDGCQYAITPTGHFHFYELIHGWQKGKLGTMWNPYYFNGSDAVHGLASVPNYPASHGCARIPMHIADYFYTLVHKGESVFVFGTPKQAGNGYVGPAPTAPRPRRAPTTAATTTGAGDREAKTTPTTKKKRRPPRSSRRGTRSRPQRRRSPNPRRRAEPSRGGRTRGPTTGRARGHAGGGAVSEGRGAAWRGDETAGRGAGRGDDGDRRGAGPGLTVTGPGEPAPATARRRDATKKKPCTSTP